MISMFLGKPFEYWLDVEERIKREGLTFEKILDENIMLKAKVKHLEMFLEQTNKLFPEYKK